MDKEKELPKRKHPRLNNYNYSKSGAYFITICTQNRQRILSQIVSETITKTDTIEIKYTLFGEIAKKQLFLMEERYSYLVIDKYVIMPDHIHIIMLLNGYEDEESTRPAITDIICAYKSLTTRECKKNGFKGKMFQTSFYEHIIRNKNDYEKTVKYIHENPMCWYYDESLEKS